MSLYPTKNISHGLYLSFKCLNCEREELSHRGMGSFNVIQIMENSEPPTCCSQDMLVQRKIVLFKCDNTVSNLPKDEKPSLPLTTESHSTDMLVLSLEKTHYKYYQIVVSPINYKNKDTTDMKENPIKSNKNNPKRDVFISKDFSTKSCSNLFSFEEKFHEKLYVI